MTPRRTISPDKVYLALLAAGAMTEDIAAYDRWLIKHPSVWPTFERLALQAKWSGLKRYGAKGICELIRWKVSVQGRDSKFKVNNNWISFMAITFDTKYPEYRGFLRRRKLRGLSEKARAA